MVNKPRIMVVEDTNLVARDIQETLNSLGYLVTSIVATGKDAIKTVNTSPPDLILMDIKLKGSLDGIETASLIHEEFDIPIIYLTALADDYTILRAKRTEASGYIIKPFNKEDLHSSIEMALYKYKMENFLKDREELLATTLKSVTDSIFTTDNSGFITFMNSSAETMTGWSQDEVLGKHIDNVFTLIDEKEERYIEKPFEEVVRRGQRITLKHHLLKTRSDRKVPVICITDPIVDDKGSIIGTVITLKDISEQKKIQLQLEDAQQLESIAMRARTLGHEFNNLLTVIRGSIDLLKQSLDKDKGLFLLLDDADTAARRASDLTNQFLAFSKGEHLVKRTESITELLKTTSNSILADSAISCIISIPPNLWQVEIDKGQISQVIYNVIRIIYNTIEDKGRIKITAKNLTIVEKDLLPIDPGLYVKTTIKGYGAVIPGDIFKQLFDPYFKNASNNGGMELSTSYSIIKNHGGYITMESGLESGTAFYIYLPASKEAIPEEPLQLSRSPMGQRRVLVMDDQELVRIIAGKILNFMGFSVDFARHGMEAVEMYSRAIEDQVPFDCVILDLTIPWGLGAKETIIKLIEVDPGVRAIVSTGYSNDPSIYNYRELGFKGVIKKPYEFQELKSIIQRIVEEK